METSNSMTLKKQSTETIFLLGMGLASSFSSTASGARHFSTQELQVFEAKFAIPQNNTPNIDNYVTYQYSAKQTRLLTEESNFFNAVQIWGEQQTSLDDDFLDTLDELLLSKIDLAPSKKRF